jgi:hypothetical protein
MLLLWHTLAGIIGIVAGVLAWRYVARSASKSPSSAPWRAIRVTAIISGIVLAVVTYRWVTSLGYSISTPEGAVRIVGLPFFVAYFDSTGNDYVGWITYVGALGNIIFWFLAPQLAAALYARVVTRQIGA